MIVDLVVALVVVALAGSAWATWAGVPTRRRRRSSPPELEGDWWSRFETEFRAYAQRATKPSPQNRPGSPRRRSTDGPGRLSDRPE